MRSGTFTPHANRTRSSALLVALLVALLTTLLTTGTASAALKPPANLALKAKTTTEASLQWSAVSTAPAYRVKYSTSSSYSSPTYKELAATSTTITGLAPATTYYIKVRVVSLTSQELSGYSSTLKVTTSTVAAPPAVSSKVLRVGSYNVRCASCYVAGNADEGTWEERRSAVVATLKSQDLDVLGVQEASQGWLADSSGKKYDLSQFEDLAARLGSPWKLTNTKRNNCVKDTTPTKCVYADQGASLGTKLLYNSDQVRLLDQGSKLLPETDTTATRHYVAWAQLQQISTGQKFVMADAHLTPHDENYQLRMDQSRVALAEVKAHNLAKLAMISVGDWNSGKFNKPTNAPYDVWIKGGFVDSLGNAYNTSKQDAPGATVEKRINTSLNSFNGFLRHANAHPTWINGTDIDYIVTTPMRVSEWETVANLDSAGNFIGRIPSDHNMVRANVWLPLG